MTGVVEEDRYNFVCIIKTVKLERITLILYKIYMQCLGYGFPKLISHAVGECRELWVKREQAACMLTTEDHMVMHVPDILW